MYLSLSLILRLVRLGYAYSITLGCLRGVVMAVGSINPALQSLITAAQHFGILTYMRRTSCKI